MCVGMRRKYSRAANTYAAHTHAFSAPPDERNLRRTLRATRIFYRRGRGFTGTMSLSVSQARGGQISGVVVALPFIRGGDQSNFANALRARTRRRGYRGSWPAPVPSEDIRGRLGNTIRVAGNDPGTCNFHGQLNILFLSSRGAKLTDGQTRAANT